MAEQFDVTARLAEGRPTVDDVEEYVAACRRLGYQHRDLTAHPTQVRDWYDGDDGMNLRVLDADHRALSAAALAAEEAVRVQADLVAQLSSAWAGRGAGAADEFLCRSSQAAQSVGTAVRRAADSAAALRDALWRAVDAKVAATEAVAARQAPHRVEWLAAARTVTNGGADVDAASELVHQRVMPFVDLDVGSDWVGAMRAAAASIDAAYDAARAALASVPRAVFEVPGDLGPARVGTLRDDPVATVLVTQTVPASFVPGVGPGGSGVGASVGPGWAPAASGWAPAAGTTPAAAWAPDPAWSGPPPAAASPSSPAPVTPPAPPMGDLGVGTQGSGVSGLGQQLADLLSGLVGSADGASSKDDALDGDPMNDPAADDEPDEKNEDNQDEEDGDGKDPEDPEGEDADPGAPDPEEKDLVDDGCAAGEQPAGAPPAQAPAAAAPLSEAPPVTAPPKPSPPAAPPPQPAPPAPAAEQTPCEKAADAIPQVGE